MLDYILSFLPTTNRDDEGASAVEYGLLVAAIAAVIVVVVFALGQIVDTGFNDTCTTIANEDSSAATAAGDC